MPRRFALAVGLGALAVAALLWWRFGWGRHVCPVAPPAAQARTSASSGTTYGTTPPGAARTARLALVIDDWGYLKAPVARLKDLHFPLTTSILPNLPYSRASAEASHAAGDEVILHCPMQSVKVLRRERNTLLTSMTAAQARTVLQADWDSVPWLTGMNNHEGSKASADRALMDVVASFLKGKGCFFLDSVTTPHSAIPAAARAAGIRWARRRIFLDNVESSEAVRRQFDRAVTLALKNGSCIAIGHPHRNTLDVLQRLAPELAAKGVTLVTVDALVHP